MTTYKRKPNWTPRNLPTTCDADPYSGGPICPKCGQPRGASGVDGGMWVHLNPRPDRVVSTAYSQGVWQYTILANGVKIKPKATATVSETRSRHAMAWIRSRQLTDERINELFDTIGKLMYLEELLRDYRESE